MKQASHIPPPLSHIPYPLSPKRRGQILLEPLIAIAVIVIVAASLATIFVVVARSQEAARRRDIAASLANEAFVAIRTIADSDDATSQGFNKLYCPPDGTCPGSSKRPGNHYKVVLNNGKWELATGEESIIQNDVTYTRYLTIKNVCRNTSTNAITGFTDPLPIARTLTSGSDTTDRTVPNAQYTTASISPTAARLILITVVARVTDAGVNLTATPPTVTGNGITYELVRSSGENSKQELYVFRGMSNSPSSGSVTIDFPSESFSGSPQTIRAVAWSIVEFGNVDTNGSNGSDAIVQSAMAQINAGTSLTVSLAAFNDLTNMTFGAFSHNADEQTNPDTTPAGYEELHDVSAGSTPAVTLETEWYARNDTSVSASWATSSNARGVAVEIDSGGGGAATTCMKSGGEEDPGTQYVTVVVTAPQMSTLSISQYITRWRNVASTQTDWSGGPQ
jgi:type II secretory pathway pseudopilin PulG